MISVRADTPENAYHMAIHVHWACKQEADCVLCSWLLIFRKYFEQRIAKAKSETGDFLAWINNKLELLLKVTHEYKVVSFKGRIDWK